MKSPPRDPNKDVLIAGPQDRYEIIHHTEDNPPPNYAELRKQSKMASAVEAVVNTAVGLLIAFVAQWLIVKAYSIPVTAYQNFIIVSWMTLISVLRSYWIRRIWNSEFWKRKRNG